MPLGNTVQGQPHTAALEAQSLAGDVEMFGPHQIQSGTQLLLVWPSACLAGCFKSSDQRQYRHVKSPVRGSVQTESTLQKCCQLRRGVIQSA